MLQYKHYRPRNIRILHIILIIAISISLISGYRAFDGGWSGVGIINRDIYYAAHHTFGMLSIIIMPILFMAGILDQIAQMKSAKHGNIIYWQFAIFISHIILLGLAFALASTGWAGAMRGGSKVYIASVIEVPRLFAIVGPEESVRIYAIHKMLVTPFVVFLSIHIMASLYHGLILKDGLIRAMFGWKKE